MCKVSIVVPIYNSEKNLNKCLDSIRNQTYNNLEIILVDNGSSDDSIKIAQGYARFDKRVKLFKMHNIDLYQCINNVTDNATGKYVLYVDSNNSWLDTNMIKFMVEKQEKYSSDAIQVDTYEVHIDYLSYDDRYNKEDGEGLILDNKYLMEELKIKGRIDNVIWGKLYKTNLIKDMLCSKQMKMEESRWLYQAMSRVERYVILHKPMVYCIKEN